MFFMEIWQNIKAKQYIQYSVIFLMVSRKVKIIIAIVVAVIMVGTAFAVLYHHQQPVFTDVSQTSPTGSLDPATAFFTTDGPLFTALFQGLTEFNGSSSSQVVPVLAQSYTVHNDQNYTFNLHTDAKFSNNQSLNASAVWFSFYRGLIMGGGPYVSDYSGILYNGTAYLKTTIVLPWGIIGALKFAGYKGLSTDNMSDNYKTAAIDLDNILSNFNYNTTEKKVMSYKDQALVVNSNYNVSMNTLNKYSFLLQDVAGWWGDIVEPSYIDAHGGVQYNTQNSYINLNGAIGSGPYEISSVGKGFSTLTLKANPDYWVTNSMVSNNTVPSIAQPAHIKTIVIKYGLSHTDRVESFDRNESQISTVSPGSFKNIINGFYDKSEANGNLSRSYPEIGTFYISMNMERSYTDNTHFREALYAALNYTEETSVYDNNYNGTPEAYAELGPLSPGYGKAFYNPNNHSLPAQNLKVAEGNIATAGSELHFYVKLPNGTKLGDTKGTDLSKHTFTLTGLAPGTSVQTAQLTIAIDSFAQIGLTFNTKLVTESIVGSWSSASATPHFVDLAWEPDYSDPIGQQLIPVFDITNGGIGNKAWVDNSTLQRIFATLDFENTTTQEKAMYNVQNLTLNQYAYMWLPVPYDIYFVQPYLHNFVWNPFVEYFYNIMYISYGSNNASPSSAMSIYNMVTSLFMAGIKLS